MDSSYEERLEIAQKYLEDILRLTPLTPTLEESYRLLRAEHAVTEAHNLFLLDELEWFKKDRYRQFLLRMACEEKLRDVNQQR